MCNGFADECPPTQVVGKYECNCQYNTEGPRCSRCKPGYVQKKWRPRTAIDKFECESKKSFWICNEYNINVIFITNTLMVLYWKTMNKKKCF